jgi:DNA-binding LacI/PurR family transcriptional regulator
MAQYAYPALTTIRQPIERIGQILIVMLMQLLAGKPVAQPHKVLTPSLIVREPCGSKQKEKTRSATMSIPGRES